jgi:dolichol-phosphate mannosyltransferase
VSKTLTENFENFEIICVVDETEDNSVSFIQSFSKGLPDSESISILEMSNHQGIEMSMNAGVDLAIGDLIYEFDNLENENAAKLIMEAYYKCVGGYDVVSIVPEKVRRPFSRIFYRLYNWGLHNKENTITHEDFRLVSRRALNRIKTINNYIPYRKALYSQCGLPTAKLTYDSSRQPLPDTMVNRMNLALETLILFTSTIQKLTLYVCLLFAAFTVAVGVYIVYSYFGAQKPVEGWTALMGFLTLGFFGIFLLFAVVFKYLSVILNTIFVNQWYTVKSVDKL